MPTLRQLADFLRSPVAAWFRERLHTDLRLHDDEVDDDEPFVDGGLSGWQWRDELLRTVQDDPATAAPRLAGGLARLQREGRLPWGGPGEAAGAALLAQMQPVLQAWAGLRATHKPPATLEPVSVDLDGQAFEAGLLPWALDPGGQPQLLQLGASRLATGKKLQPRADKLLAGWLQQLALGASGRPTGLWALGIDVIVRAAPIPADVARSQLAELVAAWQDGIGDEGPWPTILTTALESLREDGKPRQAFESTPNQRGDDQDPHLARLFPSFAALEADLRFKALSRRLYTPLAQWLEQLQVSALPDAVATADEGSEAHDD